uniref:Uncharacterized protein n=1 Tax=Biomphalaria glabrata TaxID=6526 RepID=A0A2C9KFU0_BIOGL
MNNKMFLSFLVALVMILIVTAEEERIKITIMNVTIEKCTTKCKSSLISNVDKLFCNATANMSSLSNLKDYLLAFQVRKSDSTMFKSICVVHLIYNCEEVPEKPCYCKKNGSIYEFILNITAYYRNSGGFIKATLISETNGVIAESNSTENLPIIDKDPELKTHTILINNKSLTNNIIQISDDQKHIPVEFQCETESVFENCCLNYGFNYTQILELENDTISLASFGNEMPKKMFIRISICGKVSKIYNLTIQYDSKTKNATNKSGIHKNTFNTYNAAGNFSGEDTQSTAMNLHFIIPVTLAIISIIIIISIIFIRGRIVKKSKKIKDNANQYICEENESLKTSSLT